MRIYLASHFFDAGGKIKTQQLADAIREEFKDKVKLYVPQENGEINDKTKAVSYVTDKDISKGDNFHLDRSDILIADLDGVETDSGVAAEVGRISGINKMAEYYNELIRYANSEQLTGKQELQEIEKKYIIGFTTDIRINQVDIKTIKDIHETEIVNKARLKIDNLKDNHLYRNLYVRGIIEENGKYLTTNPDNYIKEIIKEIKALL